MPESSIYDYLAEDYGDAAERQVLELLQVGLLNAPIAVAMAELDIPGLLADKALTGEEVAAAAGTDPDATARLLRAGVAVGLAAVDSGGRFTLTELGSRLGAGAGSAADMAGFWLAPTRNALDGLAEHVRSGRRVDPAAPGGVWDYFGSHPADTVKFSRAMGYVTARLLAAMTAAGYRPPSARRIVDVGGNRGTVLAWFLAAAPEAAGVLFDRPESLALAPGFLASAGVADRTELVPGNFLAEVPDGDLHVLSHVLHNWDDENVRRIAANCARAARPGGTLVVAEFVLPPVPEPVVGHVMDVLMMVLVGGRERTLAEHRRLIEPAGYAFTREVPVGAPAGQPPPWRVLEFRRD
jgi:predicted O-methyltransferase YrrM